MSDKIPLSPTEKKGLSHIKYRPDIDGLRGIAVLSVVGFHASPSWIKGGFIGVDIFFVISGFLISTIIYESLNNGTFSFSEFYARRIRRIFPALIVIMTACLLFGQFLLLADEYQQLGKHSAASAGFLSNFFFWQEVGYFDEASETKPLLHLWSLAIEEQFYIAWPLMIYLAYKRQFNLFCLGMIIATGSFIFNVSLVHEDPAQAYYSPVTRFWELSLGSILAYVSLHKISFFGAVKKFVGATPERAEDNKLSVTEANAGFRNVQSFLGVLFIGIAVLAINKYMAFPGWLALLPTMGAYLVISAGPQAWINRNVLSHRIIVWFGLISYPLYLCHWPILSFIGIMEFQEAPRSMRFTGVLVSVVLAWLIYKLIEKPIRFGKHGAKRKVFGLCALMLVIGCVGYNAYKRDMNSFSQAEKKAMALSNYDHYGGKTVEEFWDNNSCFLLTKEVSEFEKRGCSDIKFPDRPVVFLIGDSYAAYLAPGVRSFLNSRQINLVQFNSGYCAPLNLKDTRQRCADINKYIVKKVSQIKPDTLIFYASYLNHGTGGQLGVKTTYDVLVKEELSKIKKLGVKKIILLGQIPTWKSTLPKVLARKFLRKSLPIPSRTFTGIVGDSLAWDKLLKKQNYGDDIIYVSLKDQLCNEDGCLTYVSNGQDRDLIVFDFGHMTPVGADYVTHKLLAPLLTFPSPLSN